MVKISDYPEDFVWVFNGSGARFSGGVFSTRNEAEASIKRYGMSGVLTAYPLGKLAYEWAVEHELFTPSKDAHNQAQFIQGFTTASQEHYHYENGKLAGAAGRRA